MVWHLARKAVLPTHTQEDATWKHRKGGGVMSSACVIRRLETLTVLPRTIHDENGECRNNMRSDGDHHSLVFGFLWGGGWPSGRAVPSGRRIRRWNEGIVVTPFRRRLPKMARRCIKGWDSETSPRNSDKMTLLLSIDVR